MNLRDRTLTNRGKLVGRVGVEPTTKRLRAGCLNPQSLDNNSESSLIHPLVSGLKATAFRKPIRGLSGRIDWQLLQGLGIISLLVLMVAISLYWAHHPQPHVSAYAPCSDVRGCTR